MTSPFASRKIVLFLFCLATVACAKTEPKTTPSEPKLAADSFLRIRRDAQKKPLALETAIVHYVSREPGKKPFSVDLIAAVHIADNGYYRQIDKEFKNYDAVLYEMVAPPGAKITKDNAKKPQSMISMLQRGMKNLLDLDFQLDAVDYAAPNLVHADMSPKQFSQAMADRNESPWTYFMRLMKYAMSKEAADTRPEDDAQMFLGLFSKNRAVVLKQIMAEQFVDMGGTITALEGPKGSALLTDRNRVALEVLQREIDKGKKKIAVFYGGAHMPDFDKHLRADFGLRPEKTRWLPAWDLQMKPEPPEPSKKPKSPTSK
jgi:hypothetical protein